MVSSYDLKLAISHMLGKEMKVVFTFPQVGNGLSNFSEKVKDSCIAIPEKI